MPPKYYGCNICIIDDVEGVVKWGEVLDFDKLVLCECGGLKLGKNCQILA